MTEKQAEEGPKEQLNIERNTASSEALYASMSTKFVKFTFATYGVATLSGWNSIISGLDFLNYYQKKYSPAYTYPLVACAVNLIMMFIIVALKKFSTYRLRVTTTFVGDAIIMFLLPLAVIFVKGLLGIIICIIILISITVITSINMSSILSMISFFPRECIIFFSLGQGFSGVVINIIRYITLAAVNFDDEKKTVIVSAMIFYACGSLIYVLCIVLTYILFSNEFFRKVMKRSDEESLMNISVEQTILEADNNEVIRNSIKELQAGINNTDEDEVETKKVKKEEPKQKSLFLEAIKAVMDINLMIMFTYIISLAEFPGVATNLYLFGLSGGYLTNTHSLIYNICSTVGRKFTSNIKLQKRGFFILSFSRAIFLATFLLLIYADKKTNMNKPFLSVLVVVNLGLCALTNGVCTTLGYTLAPKQVKKPELKGKIGASISLFYAIGSSLGTIVASFVMKPIYNVIVK